MSKTPFVCVGKGKFVSERFVLVCVGREDRCSRSGIALAVAVIPPVPA